VRRAIQAGEARIRALARRYGISPTTVQKWRFADLHHRRADGTEGTPLHRAERRGRGGHRHLPALHAPTAGRLPLRPATDPAAPDPLVPAPLLSSVLSALLTSLRGIGLKPDGIARLPDTDGAKTKRSRFRSYPIGFFHLDIAEVHTEQGRLYLFVAISGQQTADPISQGSTATLSMASRTGRRPNLQVRLRPAP
jgi:hypothetical protein